MEVRHYRSRRFSRLPPDPYVTRLQEQLHREQLRNRKLTQELERSRQQLHQLRTNFALQVSEQTQQQTLQWQRFGELSQQIGDALDQEELFQTILTQIHLLIPCDVSAGLLLDGSTCELLVNSDRPLDAEIQSEILHQLLKELTTVQGLDLSTHTLNLRHLTSQFQPETRLITVLDSVLLVSMVQGNCSETRQTLGLLFVGAVAAEQFTATHWSLLNSVANQAMVSAKQLQLLSDWPAVLNDQPRLEQAELAVAAQSLDSLKSRVIRAISHEYRTPLTVISLAAELLAQDYPRLDLQQRQQCFAQIQQAIQKMTKLINEVIWISQAEAAEITLNMGPIVLVNFCERVVDELVHYCPAWSDRLKLDLPTLHVPVFSDPFLLQHILSHLLTNALKYSPDHEVVTLHIQVTESGLDIRVRDRGRGIPEADHQLLYNCFHRAQNVGAVTGTGLGLTIVQKCVDLLGGDITFQTHLDKGTEFRVQLP